MYKNISRNDQILKFKKTVNQIIIWNFYSPLEIEIYCIIYRTKSYNPHQGNQEKKFYIIYCFSGCSRKTSYDCWNHKPHSPLFYFLNKFPWKFVLFPRILDTSTSPSPIYKTSFVNSLFYDRNLLNFFPISNETLLSFLCLSNPIKSLLKFST